MRSIKQCLLTSITGLALGLCATATPVAAKAAATSEWKSFVGKTIQDWFALDPSFAIYEGAHEYDGKLPDWSEAGLQRKAAFDRSVIAKAGAFKNLSPADTFERDYLMSVARRDLFWLVDADQPHRNVAFYVGGGLDPNVYVSRNYADKPTRMKAMIAFFQGIPTATTQIRANLKTPMPASFVSYGTAAFAGLADYYRGDARAAFADVKDPALQAQFKDTSERAGVAMQALADWLKAQAPTATTEFALGADKFARMLKETELVDTPLDQLEAAARADLKRNQNAVKTACAQYTPGKSIADCFAKMNADKPADGPVAEARRQIPMLAAFVRDKDLLTIPGTKLAAVEESPPYNRANSAYMDPPGPLEKGGSSIYYISPPDPTWSKQKQLDYIPAKADLLFTTVHEVMPGHYLQFLHSNQAPSMVGKLWVGYGFAEGWAHYTEQMMWDAGLGNGALEVHLGQLSNALLRDCRFISAISLHARGMTEAQSKRLFIDECWIDEGNAEQQAARGTYDPAYLNYTLNKLLITKLREDWTASHGGRQAWKAFHDQFLSYGGPPVPLIRQAMMKEPAPHAVF
ncbi:hypothetical protein WSK_3526 [Novosphingobium sp. Rr 2-17]|uniref:DUF885 domain-containing protein n=1 Tax=Novosphingobium sp. Rr 2-17 TaxID=555793 RepID=UPI000269A234|nr:DUF885 domain-containing protein [Novosphingobium sp. Rr 2-17]EIZ77856.1 hypothetical protein WSK_3526 [Novosphingobium sp. Rr 2-17]